MAKRYIQKEGIDYEETFSPVAMPKSIRILLSTNAHYDYEIWQMDIKTTFLNDNLEEEINMMQPKGFKAKNQEHMVYMSKMSILDLSKHLGHGTRSNQAIKSFGFEQNLDEPCVYKDIKIK